jgi:molecular chaperone HscB
MRLSAAASARINVVPSLAAHSLSSSSSVTAEPFSYFAVLGIPESFTVSLDDLSVAHRQLQRKWHPDRYATADEQLRRRAAQLSAEINDAYSALKSPETRAMHLLAIRGNEIEEGAGGAGIDEELLEWVMSVREKIEDSYRRDQLAETRKEVAAEIGACLAEIERAFETDDLKRARSETTRLHYLHRIHSAAEERLADIETRL